MRILVVEDDAPIASIIKLGLEGARYTVDVAGDGPEGLEKALSGQYDLIILDLMLPGLDGMELCRRLRSRRDGTAVLMLTARDDVEERVRGLEAGADDYLSKPFNFAELLARVQALVRRNQVHKGRVIRIADLEIDTTLGRVTRAGRAIPLSRAEYLLLETLAADEGRVFSWTSLHERLGSDGTEAAGEALLSLQQKIDGGEAIPLIHEVGSVGFTLRAPDEALVPNA